MTGESGLREGQSLGETTEELVGQRDPSQEDGTDKADGESSFCRGGKVLRRRSPERRLLPDRVTVIEGLQHWEVW